MRLSDLQNKDIISVADGRKIGNIIDENGNVVQKKFLIGIQCYRYDENKVRVHEPFHSKELVPYNIAQKGTMEAIKFHDRLGEYKDY